MCGELVIRLDPMMELLKICHIFQISLLRMISNIHSKTNHFFGTCSPKITKYEKERNSKDARKDINGANKLPQGRF